MSVARPDLLALLALVPLVVALALTTRQRRVRGWRLGAVTTLRALLLAALVLAAAGPGVTRPARPGPRTTVYVLDASSSVDPAAALAALEGDLRRVRGRAGVVAAAGSTVWLAPPARGLDVAALREALASVDVGARDASRLAAGLRLARAGLAADGRGEVELVSDGRATDDDDDPAVEAARLAAGGVAVRTLAVGRAGPDVRAVDLAAQAPVVEEGAGVLLTARVVGPAEGQVEAEVTLERDGAAREGWTRRVTLGPAVVPLTFADRADAPGLQRYRLVVRAPGDVEPRNDEAHLALEVRGGPRVLVVSDGVEGAGAVLPALRAAGFAVEAAAVDAAPEAAADLARFDAVVLVDVPARRESGGPPALTAAAQRAFAEHARAGGGLVVVGGERAFGPGGYRGSALEEALPLRAEPPAWAEVPDVALVLLVDRSGSMGRGSKLEMAKVAAREAATFLSPRDVLGIVGFRADADWLLEPTRGAPAALVRRATDTSAAGGGTDLLPPLTLAREALTASPARVKHVVVLSDGIAPRMQQVMDLVDALRREDVTTSSVAVGPDADQDALRKVAERGGGRFHATSDLATLPRVVVGEALDAARRSASTDPFRPRVVRAARALDGVAFDQGPTLTGLQPAEARAAAEVLLAGPDDRPLLAVWDVGHGRAAAWTSDAGARWARACVGWDGFTRLWGQLVRAVARPPAEARAGDALRVWLEGDRLRARAEVAGAEALTLEPVDGGAPLAAALHEVAVDVWVGAAARPPDGLYRARVTGGGRTLAERLVPLGPWLQAEVAQDLGPDPAALEAIAAAGQPAPAPRRHATRSLAPPLLLLACALLLVEVVVRRTA
ncbi:MAG: VWA domain-containing protein [Planctomycetes bacterium]|nr:VWA domain-containing protein [Planctomycetota bacterium]